jgi:hypothetical protein
MSQMKDLTLPSFIIHLAEKVKAHTRHREEEVNELIGSAVESLVNDRAFNRDLELALEEQDSGYLVTFMEVVREGDHKISTSIF